METPSKINKALAEVKVAAERGKETTKELMPSGITWLRAAISLIPYAGGPLDHLLFDKYADIQRKNIQQAIDSMKLSMERLNEEKVSKDWFESEEALEMLSNLIQKIMYEGDKHKIQTLSNVYCLFGTKEHKDDPNKYAVLESIAKLTSNQRVVFLAAYEVVQETKEYSTGDLVEKTTAIWKSSILDYVKNTPRLMEQIKGHVIIDDELDIISSFNLLVNINTSHPQDTAYRKSGLGKLAFNYLKEVL